MPHHASQLQHPQQQQQQMLNNMNGMPNQRTLHRLPHTYADRNYYNYYHNYQESNNSGGGAKRTKHNS
jgi:hypothetical protein